MKSAEDTKLIGITKVAKKQPRRKCKRLDIGQEWSRKFILFKGKIIQNTQFK